MAGPDRIAIGPLTAAPQQASASACAINTIWRNRRRFQLATMPALTFLAQAVPAVQAGDGASRNSAADFVGPQEPTGDYLKAPTLLR